ncbi:MAG: hypothetical protein F6K00_33360 [Leptolyngbya sp. SIOISBB]|nr:hypothetical protein [Leptolyngbya sp. SIOISBB]
MSTEWAIAIAYCRADLAAGLSGEGTNLAGAIVPPKIQHKIGQNTAQ